MAVVAQRASGVLDRLWRHKLHVTPKVRGVAVSTIELNLNDVSPRVDVASNHSELDSVAVVLEHPVTGRAPGVRGGTFLPNAENPGFRQFILWRSRREAASTITYLRSGKHQQVDVPRGPGGDLDPWILRGTPSQGVGV